RARRRGTLGRGFLCAGPHLLSQAATCPPLLAGSPSARQHIAMLPPPFPVTRGTARGGVVVIRIPLFALALGAFVGVAGASAQQRNAYYRSEEHTSELQSRSDLVCRLLLEKKK